MGSRCPSYEETIIRNEANSSWVSGNGRGPAGPAINHAKQSQFRKEFQVSSFKCQANRTEWQGFRLRTLHFTPQTADRQTCGTKPIRPSHPPKKRLAASLQTRSPRQTKPIGPAWFNSPYPRVTLLGRALYHGWHRQAQLGDGSPSGEGVSPLRVAGILPTIRGPEALDTKEQGQDGRAT